MERDNPEKSVHQVVVPPLQLAMSQKVLVLGVLPWGLLRGPFPGVVVCVATGLPERLGIPVTGSAGQI